MEFSLVASYLLLQLLGMVAIMDVAEGHFMPNTGCSNRPRGHSRVSRQACCQTRSVGGGNSCESCLFIYDPHDEAEHEEILVTETRRLGNDIIYEIRKRERALGYRARHFKRIVATGRQKLQTWFKTFGEDAPDIFEFIGNITGLLSTMGIASVYINRRLINMKHVGEAKALKPPPRVEKAFEFKVPDCPTSRHLRANKSGRSASRSHPHTHNHSHPRHIRDTIRLQTSPKNSSENGTDWWLQIGGLLDFFIGTDAWYSFFEEADIKFGDLYTQLYALENSGGDFSTWSGATNITDRNLVEALEKISSEFNLQTLENITLLVNSSSKTRLLYLNEMATGTLKVPATCTHENGIAYYAGPYVFMSEVTKCLHKLIKDNATFHTISISATHKLFINEKFVSTSINATPSLNRSLGLVINSPRWEVAGPDLFIDLTAPNRAVNPMPGASGIPGANGGILIASVSFVEGGKLKIIANGGMGGKGGAGAQNKTCFLACKKENYIEFSTGDKCCNAKDLNFIFSGHHGGKSGAGGLAGRVEIFSPSEEKVIPELTVEVKAGPYGLPGDGRSYILTTTQPNKSIQDQSGIFPGGTGLCVKNRKVYMLPLTPDDRKELTGQNGGSPHPALPNIPLQYDLHDFVSPYTNFRQVSRKANHLFSRDLILNLTEYVDNNDTIQRAYRTIDRVNEFFELEVQAPSITHTHQLVYYYGSLQIRCKLAAEKANLEKKDDDFKVNIFLYSSALAKKLAISNPYEPATVVNVLDFLKQQKERIKALQDALDAELKVKQIDNMMAEYNENIQKRFEQAAYLTEKVILPEIDAVEEKLKVLTEELLVDIQKEIDNANCDIKKLEKYRQELRNQAIFNGVMGVTKLAGNFISLAHPVGQVISSGADAVKGLYPEPDKPPPPTAMVPQAARDYARNSALRFRKSSKNNLGAFLKQLAAANLVLSQGGSAFAEALKEIETATRTTTQLMNAPANVSEYEPRDSVNSFYAMLNSETFIKERQGNLSLLLEKFIKRQKHSRHKCRKSNGSNLTIRQGGSDNIELAMKGVAIVSSGVELWNGIKNDLKNIDEVTNQINVAKMMKLLLENHKKRIEQEMAPELDNMFGELSSLTDKVKGQSSIALYVINFQIIQIIRDTKLDFKQLYTAGTKIAPFMDRALEKLEEGLNVYIQIHQRLDEYQDQASLANFTANLHKNPSYFLSELQDKELDKAVRKTRNVLEAGIILKRYLLVVGTFRMWKFPMVEPALCNINNLNLTTFNATDNQTIFTFLGFLQERIQEMIKAVEDSKNSASGGDAYVQKLDFNHEPSSSPFIIWPNSTQGLVLNELFDGERVELFADPLKGPEFCDAVKFNKLSLFFKSVENNQTLEKDLMIKLYPFKLKLLHDGVSYYQFANETFIFPGASLPLQFNFQLRADGTPTGTNEYYDKILTGDITVSPYAFWSFQILPIHASVTNFTQLQPFKHKFDLYFEGAGKCVDKSYALEGNYVHPQCAGQ